MGIRQSRNTGRLFLELDTDLQSLLRRPYRGQASLTYPLDRRASIKDILESLGIPHTEVGAIIGPAGKYSLAHVPGPGQRLRIEGNRSGLDPAQPTRLRPDPLPEVRFLVDINVGKLARLLRMAGFDARLEPGLEAAELTALAGTEQRILLSRNRELFKRKEVMHGHLVRAEHSADQLREIIALYGLTEKVTPFCRCLACNTPLASVAKKEILERLEPLTRKYYHHFKICPGCRRIYWQGSHHARMLRLLQNMLPACGKSMG